MEKKSKNFCFTLYKVSEDQSDVLQSLVSSGFCKTVMFTHELGSNNDNPHIQGYLSCVNNNRLLNIKTKINSLFDFDPSPHIEVAKGTMYQNYEYITKELKSNPSFKHRVYGDPPIIPGRKKDDNKFEKYVKLVEENKISIKQIESSDRAHYIKHESYYASLISSIAKTSDSPPPFIAWLAGTTGTGKSYTAKRIAETLGYEIYEAGVENNFFNKYLQEECAIWDDYRSGPISFNNLLNLTDNKGTIINIKGSKVFFKPKILIFTSPEGIESAKTREMNENHSLDNKFDQLKRRIHYYATIKSDKSAPMTHDEYLLANPSSDYRSYSRYCNAFETEIPSFDLVQELSLKIQDEFIKAFKGHLLKYGYESYATAHTILKDITPIVPKPLIKTCSTITLSFNSNI